MKYDYLLDATAEVCPMPLLKAKLQLNKMLPGESLRVLASDAASVRDFASFISLAGHQLNTNILNSADGSEIYEYIIIKCQPVTES